MPFSLTRNDSIGLTATQNPILRPVVSGRNKNNTMARLEKVTTFIIRSQSIRQEILLFQHPTAGIQLPAGTVEPEEDPRAAAAREAGEETGLPGLKLEAYLGSLEETPVLGDHFIVVASDAYSRPDPASFNWAHFRSGITVKLQRREKGFAQVSFEEPDQWPETHYASYQITGWVPEKVLSRTATRHFFRFSHPGNTVDTWSVAIDNHIFKLFWVPLDPPPDIIAPQMPWLDFLINHSGVST